MATSKPLVIHVDNEWDQHPEVIALRAKGHRVISWEPLGVDLILSKRAWNWHDGMWPYLETALKQARKDKPVVKKEPKPKTKRKKKDA